MRYLSVCSGIEAATVAWEPLGWEPVAFSEIDPYASAVLKERWPAVPNLGDFTEIIDLPHPHVDVVVGGTPCQAFSVAGLRNSLEDARGNLTLEFVRLVDRINPAVVLWENVPGVLSTKDNAFGCFLAGLVGADEPLVPTGKRWTNAGLVSGRTRRVAWRMLDAQHFGVAQRRRRIFVVACPVDGADPAAILLEFDGDRRDTPPSREERKGTAEKARLDAALRDLLAEELQAEDPRLCEALPLVMASGQANSEFSDDVCTTQSARQYKDPPILAYSIREDAKANTFSATEIETARALQTLQPSVQSHHAQTFIIQDQATRHAGRRGDRHDGKGNGLGVAESDTMYTLTGGDRHAVAAEALAFDGYNQTVSETSQTIRADKSDGDHVGMIFEPIRMVVRRLLPVECSRLQGFPDDHAKIPWKGKPLESCPDGHQYKCYGNSMAVPVIAWLGSRIQSVLLDEPFVYGIPEAYRQEIESRR